MPLTHIQNRHDYQTPELLDYIQQRIAPEDNRHRFILDQMRRAHLPEIQIGAAEGKILHCLAKSCRASKAVEIGTLGGYSALWIADTLTKGGTSVGQASSLSIRGGTATASGMATSGGHLYTLEMDPAYAALAKASLAKVGMAECISIIVGDARTTLQTIEPEGPFDFCFIDADKVSYPYYLRWAASHLRPGGIVAADNAYLFGKVHLSHPTPDEQPAVLAMQEFITILTDRSSFSTCMMIPTGEGLAVGVK